MSSRSLKDQIQALEQIQELDLNILSLTQKKDALPVALQEVDQRLSALVRDTEKKNETVLEIEKTIKQTQAAQELNQDRLNRSDSKLGDIQNTKEFQAINSEVSQLKKMKEQLEQQLKTNETQLAEAKKAMEEASASRDEIQKERDTKASALEKESGTFGADLKTLEEQRLQYVDQIDRATLAKYDRVRKARMGLGFVPALNGRCNGCNMTLPPQLFNQLHRQEELHQCPSCNRLIYLPESKSDPEKK